MSAVSLSLPDKRQIRPASASSTGAQPAGISSKGKRVPYGEFAGAPKTAGRLVATMAAAPCEAGNPGLSSDES